ncbi:MAG: type IV pilus twitching motility protein PilT [Desulfotomaculaceae bacterium]|nr:type IV pilus twitching motility protein PilT [Desulfotomaculaceae bacterium]
MMTCDEIFTLACQAGASDIHIVVNCAPVFRLNGALLHLDGPELSKLDTGGKTVDKLDQVDTDRMAREMMNEEQYQKFQKVGELDFSYSLPGVSRFRVNVFRQRGSVSIALRPINSNLLTFQQLGLPESLETLCYKPRGMVLVTGPTGSGKSTTLAAMIDLINRKKRHHIITLEDPIEFLHQHKKCIISQREVGQDTGSFASALRAALREDPDVILVGEMRDTETISIAITAAETGHLVFGTLHTSSAAQTIDRIIDVFEPHQQQQIRVQLGNTLQGVVSQTLIPRIDKPGRIVAVEILMANHAIRNLIREGKTYQIISQLQIGARLGMQSLDTALRNLFQKKIISREEALSRAADPDALAKLL